MQHAKKNFSGRAVPFVGTSAAPAPFPRRGVLLHVPVKFTGPTAALAPEHVGRVSGPTNVTIFDRCAKFVRDAWRDLACIGKRL